MKKKLHLSGRRGALALETSTSSRPPRTSLSDIPRSSPSLPPKRSPSRSLLAVTEADMAIAMASVGGAGFLHYNMTQEEQIANLKAVKAHRLGYVTRPEVVSPDATLEFLDELATRRGFTSACVTDTGAVGGKLLGLVTSRDAELVADRSTKVVDVMTSASDLLVGSATDDVAALEELLLKSKKGKMPVVNAETGELVGLITRASIKQKKLLPPPGAPSLDKKGRLLCGAAIGTRPADRDARWRSRPRAWTRSFWTRVRATARTRSRWLSF